MEKVLPILHKVDLFQEEICLLSTEALVREHRSSCILELIIGSLNLLDVDLLLL